MRAVMPLVNFLWTLSTLFFVPLDLFTFDACFLECVTLAGVGRPSFLTAPWAILSESLWLWVYRGLVSKGWRGEVWDGRVRGGK